ncbi:MAG: endolytic transglycosylase MltG [Patescibacteria group bacterium]
MKKFIIKLIVFFGLAVAFWFFILVINGNGSDEKTFVIREGQGVNEISQELYDVNLIKNKFVFETWLWLKKSEGKIIAGVYQMPKDISIRHLSNLLMIGPGQAQYAVTLLEGWTRELMKDTLEAAEIDADRFIKLSSQASDWQGIYDFLADAPSEASLEGYIFPDTYFVDKATSEEDLIKKTLNNFDRKLNQDFRDEIKKQGKTIFEVVTLAAIIEREVPNKEDKKMIADIFLKRLVAGIGLQSDATVNYVTGKGLAQPSYDDLQIDSPYNTYKYRGLPPGPIANPGLDSIEAVIYPTKNDYYYFLTTKEGEVIYSIDYEEHLDNKAKYLD